jgi:hypothetical protein
MADDFDPLDFIFGPPSKPPVPGKLQPPPAPTPDAFEQLRESFEYEAARLKSGKAATVAPSGWDAELPATAPTAIPLTDAPLAKRAPTTDLTVGKTANGWSIERRPDGQITRAWSADVTDPEAAFADPRSVR